MCCKVGKEGPLDHRAFLLQAGSADDGDGEMDVWSCKLTRVRSAGGERLHCVPVCGRGGEDFGSQG